MDREKVQEHILYNTGYKIEFTTTTKTKTASSEKKASRSTLARLQIQRCENKNIYSSSNTSLSVCVMISPIVICLRGVPFCRKLVFFWFIARACACVNFPKKNNFAETKRARYILAFVLLKRTNTMEHNVFLKTRGKKICGRGGRGVNVMLWVFSWCSYFRSLKKKRNFFCFPLYICNYGSGFMYKCYLNLVTSKNANAKGQKDVKKITREHTQTCVFPSLHLYVNCMCKYLLALPSPYTRSLSLRIYVCIYIP